MLEKMLIHVPHASLYIPEEYIPDYDLEVLSHEMLVMTDWYCNELFDCEAEMVAMQVSRLVCDVERFRDDRDESMSRLGMGLYYTKSSDKKVFRKFSEEKREEILTRYYDPHHGRLAAAVAERLKTHGECLIIDGHSFYPVPLPYELDREDNRPDICIGTDDFHTPKALVEKWVDYLKGCGLSVKINSPFAGALVPMEYYMRDARVGSVMIEVNRRLYIDKKGQKTSDFDRVKKVLNDMILMAE